MSTIKIRFDKIKNDLIESKINLKVALLFIPVGFLTYLFHEFGHWIVGECLGNEMILRLNNADPKNGYYIDPTHNLYVSIGGPSFTIIQAIIFWTIIEKTKSIYVYPFIFLAAFLRFFSIAFGGFSKQDEARISSLLNINSYMVAIIVLLVLFMIVGRSSYKVNLKLKAIGYYTILSTLSILLVIFVDELLV